MLSYQYQQEKFIEMNAPRAHIRFVEHFMGKNPRQVLSIRNFWQC